MGRNIITHQSTNQIHPAKIRWILMYASYQTLLLFCMWDCEGLVSRLSQAWPGPYQHVWVIVMVTVQYTSQQVAISRSMTTKRELSLWWKCLWFQMDGNGLNNFSTLKIRKMLSILYSHALQITGSQGSAKITSPILLPHHCSSATRGFQHPS